MASFFSSFPGLYPRKSLSDRSTPPVTPPDHSTPAIIHPAYLTSTPADPGRRLVNDVPNDKMDLDRQNPWEHSQPEENQGNVMMDLDYGTLDTNPWQQSGSNTNQGEDKELRRRAMTDLETEITSTVSRSFASSHLCFITHSDFQSKRIFREVDWSVEARQQMRDLRLEADRAQRKHIERTHALQAKNRELTEVCCCWPCLS
jgi:hypothetical protein